MTTPTPSTRARSPFTVPARLTPELLARHDRPGPRYTSYPTALEFTPDHGNHRQRLESIARSSEPLALYVHLPFCAHRCTFCACHVVVGASPSLADRYLEAVTAEIETVAQILGTGHRFIQLHWGGGTPTFHDPAVLSRLHQTIIDHFEPVSDAEVAVEVDPRVTDPAHLSSLRAMGFNRLSVGVQDSDEQVQELIGRRQTHEETHRLVTEARSLGFRSINFDLVYGLPGQSVESFERTMDAVLELAPERIAAYSFAYVPWMRPHQRRIDPGSLPDSHTKFELLCRLVSTLTDAGYMHVGMDHFAVRSDEMAIAAERRVLRRNFMGYTTIPNADVVAFGTSAISEIGGAHAQNHRRLSDYLSVALDGGIPVERGLVPTADDLIRREVIADLMCNAAVDLSTIARTHGVDPSTYFATELAAFTQPGGLVDEGLATVDQLEIVATELGRLFVRRLAMTFDAHLDSSSSGPRFSRTI